jgi:signal transduction histidine kinase
VLEINGLYPHQFCWHNKTFLEELASIVSPFVYHQHLLYGLHKLNEIAVKKKNAKEMYWEIAHRLAVIFLSHSATLWNSEQQRDKYKCVGWYKNRLDVEQHDVIINNAVKAEDKITLCHNRSDVEQHNAIINNAVKAEGKITLCYNVAKDWIKSQPQEFQALKIKHFCVIPIYALNNKPIGSIFLYNQTNEGFGKRWLPEIDLVSKHVALLLEAMQMEQQKEQYMQKKVARNINFIAHDIKLYANLLKDRVISFKNYVSAEFKPNDKQKRRIHLLNYDVITDANDLVENIEWFISDANKSEGHDAVTQAQNVFDTAPLERLNFREQFNKVARSYWQVHKKTGVDIDDEWHDQEPYLNMHGSNLRKILLNLVSNAVKYTASATLPLIEAEFLADELEFKISNRAACLEEGEEFRLFEELFRGYHAESSGVEGTGQGLFIASEICKLYKIGLYYDSKIDPITNVGCLHTFTLSFPPKMLKLEKRR